MSRIFVGVVIAVLLFGGVLAADLALQNPEMEPANNATDAQQQDFAEATAPFIEIGVPLSLFTLVVGSILVAVRRVGG